MRKLITAALIALAATTAASAYSAPRTPMAPAARLDRARTKATKATKASRAAIARADAAIERCEAALVGLCEVEHGLSSGLCEDAQLTAQFAACRGPVAAE